MGTKSNAQKKESDSKLENKIDTVTSSQAVENGEKSPNDDTDSSHISNKENTFENLGGLEPIDQSLSGSENHKESIPDTNEKEMDLNNIKNNKSSDNGPENSLLATN